MVIRIASLDVLVIRIVSHGDWNWVFSGTGAWESALTNTLSPGDKIISFRLGQFSLLWIDQMQRYNFDVDVVDCEWGAGADLEILKQKLQSDYSHSVKAVCIVHNETSTGVTNDIGAMRKVLGKHPISPTQPHVSGYRKMATFAANSRLTPNSCTLKILGCIFEMRVSLGLV